MAVTEAKIGYGTTFKWGANFVAEITRVGPVNLTASKQNATSLGSDNSYLDILPGLIDPGDIEIEGWFRPDDTAQAALVADMNSRTSRTWIIAFPTALSGTTWTADGYVTGFSAGDATPEGIIPFSATISVIGKPTLGVTAGDDLTGLVFTGDQTGIIATVPAFAGATYAYTWDGSAENTFTVTPTCAAADSITVNGNTVVSGAASSPIDTLPDALVTVTVITKTAGKSNKIYTITVFDGL